MSNLHTISAKFETVHGARALEGKSGAASQLALCAAFVRNFFQGDWSANGVDTAAESKKTDGLNRGTERRIALQVLTSVARTWNGPPAFTRMLFPDAGPAQLMKFPPFR